MTRDAFELNSRQVHPNDDPIDVAKNSALNDADDAAESSSCW